jgi:hypothetical protein
VIDPDRVEEILIDSLHTNEEVAGTDPSTAPEGAVVAEGILTTFAFHPERLESHRAEVREMLDQLPLSFRAQNEGGGGGWSFLNACVVRDRALPDQPFEKMEQWTGLHLRMDQLLALGQGLGFVKSVLPRAQWGALPGGMPYYIVTLGGNER